MLLIAALVFAPAIEAQVTIGHGDSPEKAALLQLKDIDISDPDHPEITAKKGGLLLPRVKLVNIETLEPFIPNDAEWASNKDDIGLRHAGLIVYNMHESLPSESDPNKIFRQGEYVWNGKSWSTFILPSNIEGINGISSSESSNNIQIKLGGELLENTDIDLKEYILKFMAESGGTLKIEGDPDIDQDSKPALEVIGKFRLSPSHVYDGEQQRLVINQHGDVGVEGTKNIISLMTYAQSKKPQDYKHSNNILSSYNSSSTCIVVEWEENDLVVNNITSFDETDNEFEILSDGCYEISGYVNYAPASSSYSALNVIIQCKCGGNDWEDLSLGRYVFTKEACTSLTYTVVVPGATEELKQGDRIRMILEKPSGIGNEHGTVTTVTWGIKKPTGGKFSKGIKIVAI